MKITGGSKNALQKMAFFTKNFESGIVYYWLERELGSKHLENDTVKAFMYGIT